MQHLLILFFATFSAAFMATVPPGLLNVNAAKTSVEKNKLNGVVFSLGVSTMIMLFLFPNFYIKTQKLLPYCLKLLLWSLQLWPATFLWQPKATKRRKSRK
jgi:threonine/homoserine/homoserine lactone efflux protein